MQDDKKVKRILDRIAAEWIGDRSDNDQDISREGSLIDHPERARTAYRSTYPEWQRVFNVGFGIVMEVKH